jgi:hypothetical protein
MKAYRVLRPYSARNPFQDDWLFRRSKHFAMDKQSSDLRHTDERMPLHDEDGDSWSFLALIVSAAAACLLLYLFLLPGFHSEDRASTARSARPGAVTQTTRVP